MSRIRRTLFILYNSKSNLFFYYYYKIGCQLGDGGAKLLTESIYKWKNFKVLNICHNNINVFSLTELSKSLQLTKKFEKLILSENNLNPLPINETFEIFGNIKNIKYIDLSSI